MMLCRARPVASLMSVPVRMQACALLCVLMAALGGCQTDGLQACGAPLQRPAAQTAHAGMPLHELTTQLPFWQVPPGQAVPLVTFVGTVQV